jgi:CheY-like chemotaxis protein
VLVDSGQLQNTLINLSLNARDAMTSGGCLTIRTEKRPANVSASGLEAADCVLLSVIDDGAGMSEETLEQAFDPFFTTKPPGEGSGLGLSGAYGFVRQSGGSIEVESELGVGTRVFVMLPRTDQPLAHPRDIAAARAKVSASRSVLLVKDDMAARATVTAMLTQLGHRVTAAEEAPAALRLLETTPFDILVTDIGLPGGMSGDQLADRARSMRPIHIVCVTGYANDPIAERIRDRGYRLLSKPVRMQDLANALDAARHPAS